MTFAYSIKAMLPKYEYVNNKDLIFTNCPEKNDKVLFFKSGFKDQLEAQKDLEHNNNFDEFNPLLITFYSIGDRS